MGKKEFEKCTSILSSNPEFFTAMQKACGCLIEWAKLLEEEPEKNTPEMNEYFKRVRKEHGEIGLGAYYAFQFLSNYSPFSEESLRTITLAQSVSKEIYEKV